MVEKFLMMAAVILFALAFFSVPLPPRINLMAGGLALWSLAIVLRLFGAG